VEKAAELSFFFPAHDEEANLEGLVREALEVLPHLAERFEIIAVDDGSRDNTPAIAERLALTYPDVFRVVHHPTNLGYGAALRSGFGASRYALIAFIDGDRQFKVMDVGRLIGRIQSADSPDVVVGYRIHRADPIIRLWYARIYRWANRIFFGVRVSDLDCACKLFRRRALSEVRVASGGAFFTAELLIKLRFSGRTIEEVGVSHYPRTAGSPTGAKPRVVLRAVRDFWSLRVRLWFARGSGMNVGEPILGSGSSAAGLAIDGQASLPDA
jgi:glycosyltransferase involved in cell wall biosynthesis